MEDDGLTVYHGAELTPERARFWLALDGWQADEAAHLLCCIDPRALNRWAALNGGTVAVSFPVQFGEVLALLQRAGEAGAMLFPAAPGDVIRWAMSKGLRLPAPLIPAGAVVRGGRWTDEATKAGESLTEPAPAAAEPVPGVVAAAKTAKATQAAERVAREDARLGECEAQGMVFDRASLLRLPDGIGEVAPGLRITRQSLATDVKAALRRRFETARNGAA